MTQDTTDLLNPETAIDHFHAHVYFRTDEQREIAMQLRHVIEQTFDVVMGRVHDRNVGPHTAHMYQVAFRPAEFDTLVPWLMLNNGGLSILVHPGTGNDLRDHTIGAAWIGEQLPVDVTAFRR